ncbi:MAG: hypothetical protein IJW53_02320 [Clostridia bacterium]|nr:hypothetical protein [Clostridia bacterium]
MRNLKKMLVVICVFALLTVGCVFAAVAADDNAGTVEELNNLITSAENASGAAAKYNAILKVADYLNTKKIDSSAEGYDAAIAAAHKVTVAGAVEYVAVVDVDGVASGVAYDGMSKISKLLGLFELPEDTEGLAELKVKLDSATVRTVGLLIAEIDADIETTLTTGKNQIAINKAKRIISEFPLSGDTSSLAELEAELAELEAAQERAIQINLTALDADNLVTNYDLPVIFEEDWQERPVGIDSTNVGGDWTIDLKSSANQVGILEEADGNKYFVHKIFDTTGKISSYIQDKKIMTSVTPKDGFVIEFDITTFGEFQNGGVVIETGSVEGTFFPPAYFCINGSGDICKNDKSTVVLKGAIVKGEWLHVMIVFDYDLFTYKLYVEGELITEYDAKYQSVTTFDHNKVRLRFNNSGTAGEVAYDNLKVYGGNSYRNITRLEEMTDGERFSYFVDYFTSDDRSVTSRTEAYNKATDILSKFWVVDETTGEGQYTEAAEASAEVKAAVNAYLAFDLDILLADVKAKNLERFVELVTDLQKVSRTANTVATRQQKAAAINNFLGECEGLIDNNADNDGKDGADYSQYTIIFNNIVREAEYDLNASTFVRHIERFKKAPTLAAKERYYQRAKELVDNDGIDLALIRDTSNPYRNNFKDLIAAYQTYADADSYMLDLVKENNSVKIVQCIGKISIYGTEEEWNEHSDEMNKYLFVIKDVVLGRDADGMPLYDVDYEGVKEAVEFFNSAYSYFYELLQDEHVAYIENVLELILASDQYIEKMGMVAVVERYVADNDVNLKDERIVKLLNNLDTCKAELVLREEDYAEVLVQNAVYFVDLVERMRTAETYGEQRKYFEEATPLYYYLDSRVEGAARAVEIYDEYKVNLDRIAESSVTFIDAVAVYKACQTDDEKYAALVECYYNAQFVELSYEGAEEAMAEYLAAYNEYVGYAESVNEDLVEAGNAVGSFRANCGVVNIIAVIIKKIFGI